MVEVTSVEAEVDALLVSDGLGTAAVEVLASGVASVYEEVEVVDVAQLLLLPASDVPSFLFVLHGKEHEVLLLMLPSFFEGEDKVHANKAINS